MNEIDKEILVITQEECAEVIQEISKIFRFGIDNKHKSGAIHREVLESEVGDLLFMIDLLFDRGVIKKENVDQAKQEKYQKLQIYSNIYK